MRTACDAAAVASTLRRILDHRHVVFLLLVLVLAGGLRLGNNPS
jgi:hypothetical protein